MESLANAMEKLIRRVLVQSGKCPECSEPLYSWRAKNKDGSERCKPTCMVDGIFVKLSDLEDSYEVEKEPQYMVPLLTDKEGNKKILVERRESTTSFGIMRMRTTGMSC